MCTFWLCVKYLLSVLSTAGLSDAYCIMTLNVHCYFLLNFLVYMSSSVLSAFDCLLVSKLIFCSVIFQDSRHIVLFPKADRRTHTHVQLAQQVTELQTGVQDFPSCCVTDSCRWLSLRWPGNFIGWVYYLPSVRLKLLHHIFMLCVSMQQENICSLEGILSHFQQWNASCIYYDFFFLYFCLFCSLTCCAVLLSLSLSSPLCLYSSLSHLAR